MLIRCPSPLQITVGRPRPDIVARCVPPLDYTSNPLFGLTSWTICTRTDELQEGFRSFPSGHSSFGWAGMWYLALFAAGSESGGVVRSVEQAARDIDPILVSYDHRDEDLG
jgi:hypothetical protein